MPFGPQPIPSPAPEPHPGDLVTLTGNSAVDVDPFETYVVVENWPRPVPGHVAINDPEDDDWAALVPTTAIRTLTRLTTTGTWSWPSTVDDGS
ncbi:DUF6211 family protein [Streptomyces sp. BI20]|uniref:DUF6211 family protein n=1 Tax=Streptomyces sp. BI20 TaxID=3403460 RepID=UPI003C7845C6